LPIPLAASANSTNVLCNGDCTGSIDLTANGGSAPYNYLWTPGGMTTEDLVSLCPGTYTALITDALGDTVSVSATISEPTAMVITTSPTSENCGQGDGAIALTVTGATLPYAYAWTGPGGYTSTLEDITALVAGTYVVVINDGNGCSTTATVVVGGTVPPTVTMTKTDPSSCGATDGDATVAASGGTTPYTYLWDDPSAQTNSTAGNLGSGTYTVVVTDVAGCSATGNITLSDPGSPTLTIVDSTDVTCFGGNDGSAIVIATGGTSPYTYAWSGGSNPSDSAVTGLSSGIVSVTVTDAGSCSGTITVTIGEPSSAVTIDSVIVSDIMCLGDANGAIDISVSGGLTPYAYLWNPGGAVTEDLTGLSAGSYLVVVTDLNGCSNNAVAVVSEPTVLDVAASATPENCGQGDGSISATVTGGTPTYASVWTGPSGFTSTSLSNSNLAPGTYQLTVNDANGCIAAATAVVSSAAAVSLVMSKTDPSACGASDGDASVTVSGGTTPYSYLWDDPAAQTNATAINLSFGAYSVTVIDNGGCTDNNSITLTDPGAPSLTLVSSSNVSCFGGNDGMAEVGATAGTIPYTYAWSDGSNPTSAAVIGLSAGMVNVTVTDADGCSGTISVTLSEPTAALSIDATNVTDLQCFGDGNGLIDISVSGGTVNYNYLWSPGGQNTQDLTGLGGGTHSVVVTDQNGCMDSTSATVVEPAVLSLTTSSVAESTSGAADGSATVVVTGGIVPYSYSWNDIFTQSGPTATNLLANTYTVSVFDANGCLDTVSVTVGLGTGIAGLEPQLIVRLFPNPVSETLNILISFVESGNFLFRFYDPLGRMVKSEVIGKGLNKISVSDLPTGVYLYELTDLEQGGSEMGRVSITR
ncbi:MAG: T9SS type A sorting domain-containing protein, partial [Flavobacteriales bacterium]|nr:T9SS type A sorting domain-containing protein [Flavobacteriales bacterium]